MPDSHATFRIFHRTSQGEMVLGDCLQVLSAQVPDESVDLIVTSPPFGLIKQKDYGNVPSEDYVSWFLPFAREFRRVLKPSGSLVIDIGGSWVPGQPVRSLYHFKLVVALVEELGLHLAQEFFWWNPSKLPSPAEWVTIRKIRVKDAVNTVWWFSKTPWPKASNRRVLQPYSGSMQRLIQTGNAAARRPSGHDISEGFSRDLGGSIPPNLISVANTESNSHYMRYCREKGITPHPARFPSDLPEYFIRMLTDPGDWVIDPFAGSCTTGEVSERLRRRWLCCEMQDDYLAGAVGRFLEDAPPPASPGAGAEFYRAYRPGLLWGDDDETPLREDGGRTR